MNVADAVAVGLIIVFIPAGWAMGAVRSFAAFMGVVAAFRLLSGFTDRPQGTYVLLFIAIAAGFTAVGFILYGATRFHPIDVLEGVFGALLGLCLGWGLARFVFHVYILYQPDAPFTAAIYSSAFGMDVYYVSPIRDLLRLGDPLMNPKIFKESR
ncbi:MAG: hypothetical protein AB1742_15510 [bacterium]